MNPGQRGLLVFPFDQFKRSRCAEAAEKLRHLQLELYGSTEEVGHLKSRRKRQQTIMHRPEFLLLSGTERSTCRRFRMGMKVQWKIPEYQPNLARFDIFLSH